MIKRNASISLMFVALFVAACTPQPSSSDPVTSEPIVTSTPTSETSTTEPVSENNDPIVSPSIQLTPAPAYSGTFWSGVNFTLTGAALRTHLKDYMWARFTQIDYNTVSNAVLVMDKDPANANNILSLYDLHSIPKSQQNFVWNREHSFPQSKLADGVDALRAGSTKKTFLVMPPTFSPPIMI